MILLIDNYDSFSYNLFQLVGSISPDIRVTRNDAMTIDEIRRLAPKGILLSPGPGRPEDAGICVDVVRELGGEIPMLGVCLGEQAMCIAYGAKVGYAKKLMHGKQSLTELDPSCPIFRGCPEKTMVGRYHSLAVREETLPADLKTVARADDGEVMAVMDLKKQVFGLQFHPESILTPDGPVMLRNFMQLCGEV